MTSDKKMKCAGCGDPILDQFLLSVIDQSWHTKCVTCIECKVPLEEKCFSRDGLLYCRQDFFRLFAAKCTSCSEAIAPNELVMRVLDHVYHLACFQCTACGHLLQKGDQFLIRDGRLLCRGDFEKELSLTFPGMALHPASGQFEPGEMCSLTKDESIALAGMGMSRMTGGSPNSSPALSVSGGQANSIHTPPHTRIDGRRGPKRPRTILTTAQRRAFKASFEVSQKPCRKVRETLAKETGLSVRIVQVWFQNQRAKLKKIQRKQQQQMQQAQRTGSDFDAKCKDTYSSLDAMTDSSDDDQSFQNHPLQYISHSPDGSYYSPHGEGYTKSELGIDSESSLTGLEDVLISRHGHNAGSGRSSSIPPGPDGAGGQPPALVAHHHPDFHPTSGLHPPAGISMNPIDKLYSMQSSYFAAEMDCDCNAMSQL